ncbi:MAG: hypothetical protein ACK6DA_02830 [Candidatus Kapaibacterium sp.]
MSKGFNDFTKGGNKPHDRRNRENKSTQRSPLAYSEVIIGIWNPRDTGQTEDAATVVIANASTLREEMASDWDEKAAMSLDGIFRPVSLHGSGGLPRFAQPIECENCSQHAPRGAQPPITYDSGSLSSYDILITADYLNPLTNPADFTYGYQSGHDFDIIARDGDADTGINSHISSIVTELNSGDPYSEDYRFFAFKGPMVIQGWGYDTDGKPVPNASDTEEDAESGIFTTQNLKDQFLDNWLKKSKTWPVGPVDLVWDRSRRVWTARPAYKMISATLKEDLAVGGSANAYQDKGSALWDSDGNTIYLDSTNNIVVNNKTNEAYEGGDHVICYWDTDACEYWVLNGYETIESTTTTTTLSPVYPTKCTGSCEWISNDGKTWTLLSDTCGEGTTTTTTSTTTTSTTTTTTDGPTTTSTTTTTIDCNPSQTTTTSTTSTTTTTPAPGDCECVQPIFCPTFTGQKTTTSCTEYNPGEPPNCTTTTCPPCDCGSYTTTTTTIHPGSTTTTTTEAPCEGNCEWVYIDCWYTGRTWAVVHNDCPIGGLTTELCTCTPPDRVPNDFCDTYTSDCDRLPATTTTTIAPPGCGGGCMWLKIPGYGICLSVQNCASPAPNGDRCYCPQPTELQDCVKTFSPCIPLNTTTTLEPTTTPDPCWECCNSTTTSTTSAPCNGGCYYFCWAGVWVKSSDTCDVGCPCPDARGPCFPAQSLYFRCDTTNSTTTSTTTTSAPTGACCFNIVLAGECGECIEGYTLAQCNAVSGAWHPGETCVESCPPPCGRCCYNLPWTTDNCQYVSEAHCNLVSGTWTEGETCSGAIDPECAGEPPATTTTTPTTTTTTAAPTTTTTAAPTTTTTAGPEGACCGYPVDSCTQTTEANCIANGGIWQGAATDCDVCYGPCTGSCNYLCNEFNQYYLDSSNCVAGTLIQCLCPYGVIGSPCEGPSSLPCATPTTTTTTPP